MHVALSHAMCHHAPELEHTHRKLATGKALQAAHLEMAKLNKALVATLIRDKFFVKKLAMVLPGGAHFHP